MRTAWLAPAATVLALAGAGGATGAQWSEPLLIAPTPRPAQPVAVRIAGSEAIAAWRDYRVVGHGRATDTTDYAVWAAAGAVGGAPGPAQRLDRGVPSDPLPALATSASGYAVGQLGRVKRKALPPPSAASTQMRPPWASTTRRHTARPIPVPSVSPLMRANMPKIRLV